MKKTTLTIVAALLIIGCKKKDDAKPSSTTSNKATLTVTKNTNNTFTAKVHYINQNFGDDAVRLFINDTFTRYYYLNPTAPDSDYTYTFPDVYSGSKYYVQLLRYDNSKPNGRDTLASINGN